MADGTEIEPLAEADVARAVEQFRRMDVEAIAVCLLWSIVNGDHERRGASQFVPERAMEQNNSWAETWKGEYQHTRGSWLTFSTQWGHFNQVNAYTGFAADVPRSLDIVSLQEDGDALSAGRWSWGGQEQGRAVATMYKPSPVPLMPRCSHSTMTSRR